MASIPDSHAGLLNGIVTFITTNSDGYPQATAVVVRLEDGTVHTSVSSERQKYKNLIQLPKATVFAIDPTNQLRTIEVRADVRLVADPGKTWSKSFLPDADLEAMDGAAERFHVILTPHKVNIFGNATEFPYGTVE